MAAVFTGNAFFIYRVPGVLSQAIFILLSLRTAAAPDGHAFGRAQLDGLAGGEVGEPVDFHVLG